MFKLTTPILISLTVLSALSFSSCGKSKDTKTTTDVVSESAPAPEQNGAPVPPADAGLSNVQNAPLPAPTTLPAAPIGSKNNTPSNTFPADSDAETQTNSSSVIIPPLKPVQISSAVDVQFDEAEAVKTGGKLKALNYTSAGADGLMTEFKSYGKKVSAEQQKMNQNLASAIVSAKLRRQSATGEIFVDIVVDEFGKLQSYKMKATDEPEKMSLSLASSTGGDLEFQGGFLKCTDLDGGCENAYAKIKLSGAYSRIIFRSSYADSNFGIYTSPTAAVNLNFELWTTHIYNKVNRVPTRQKIEYVQLSSYEVVGGKSAMGVLVVTEEKDMLGLSVPLLAADKGAKVLAPVAKLSDISKSNDLGVLAASYTQKLSQALKDVQLIANNGLGQIRLLLSFSADKSDSKIFMTLSKVQKPTMSVFDVQKFEATIKSF